MSSSAPTPWSLLNIEGNDDASDDEVQDTDNNVESAEANSILSPASRRAKKRQAAARNKKAKQEAKQQAAGTNSSSGNVVANTTSTKKGGNTASASAPTSSSADAAANGLPPRTSSLANGNGNSTSNKSLPPAPPTFADLKAGQINGVNNSSSGPGASSSSAAAKLGDPFLQPSGGSNSLSNGSTSTSKTTINPPTFVDDSISVATETEDEDTSLLIDEDDESSSYASDVEGDEGDQAATPALEEQDRNQTLAEPATPRPSSSSTLKTSATQTKAGSTIKNAAADLKIKTNTALDSVTRSDAVPSSIQNLAEKARDSNLLKPEEAAAATAQPYGSDHDPSKKWKSVVTRTVWTLVMVFGFFGLMTLGHVWLIILVMFCQAAVFKEISALFDVAAKPVHSHGHHHHSKSQDKAISPTRAARDARARAERERWSKVTSWYFFAATNYFLHGETIIYYFKHIVFVDAYFIPFARHHRFISFMLYTLGFVGFVTNLKRNQLRRQFGLFCWIHMSLLLIVVSSHFIVNNILEGIIWFWLPASLVVVNDIAAYVWGMLFGRTQLIKLSPKKTVEGFVGAAFTTVVFAYFWATLFMRFNYMICPATDLGTNAFSTIECQPNDAFIWRYFSLPQEISGLLSVAYPVEQIPWAPFQFHAVIMGIFASLVAPFGGFFASGFKRAFNVKDFGDSIPGHGGMTDRMDCQFLMGLFAYVYYSSIIRDNHVTVGQVMQTIVSSLSQQEQAELAKALAGYLAQQGVKWK